MELVHAKGNEPLDCFRGVKHKLQCYDLEPSEIDWDNGIVIIIFVAARLQNFKFLFQQVDKRRSQDRKLVRTEGVPVG